MVILLVKRLYTPPAVLQKILGHSSWNTTMKYVHIARFDNILEIKRRSGTMDSIRLYCAENDGVILLLGGHKDSQSKEIKIAIQLLKGVKNGQYGRALVKVSVRLLFVLS